MERLFHDDESQESATYEIEFKIFDKNTKNVKYVRLTLVTVCEGRTRKTVVSQALLWRFCK